MSHSSRNDSGYAPGVVTTWPRPTWARSTPTSASATRWPAAARSAGWSCTWTLLTRASRPPGWITSRSPVPTLPDQSVPVTTVPIPRSENERSTGSRTGPSDGRLWAAAAARSSAARSSSRPRPVRDETSTTSAPA